MITLHDFLKMIFGFNISFDLSSGILWFWGVLTLFGVIDNGDYFSEMSIGWKLIAIYVLYKTTGKIAVLPDEKQERP